MSTFVSAKSPENRPEFTPEYWARKRLPDSMKGINPADLALIARMNEAARQTKLREQANAANAKKVRRADGTFDLTGGPPPHQQQVVQTGAASPLFGSKKTPSGMPSFPNQAAAPARMQPAAAVAPPSPVVDMLTKARAAKLSGDLKTARDYYRQVLKIEPYNREVLINAGRVEHAMGEIDNAIHAYQYLLGIEPNNAVALNDLGLCQARKGDMEAALKSLQAAVVAKPRSNRYRYNLAKVLIETNQVESARHVLAQLKGAAMADASIGALLAERGRNEEARSYLEKAIAADPNLQAAQAKLASLATASQGPVAQVGTAPTSTAPTAVQTSSDQLNGPELAAPIQR